MQKHFATGQMLKARGNKNVLSFDLKVFRQLHNLISGGRLSGMALICQSEMSQSLTWAAARRSLLILRTLITRHKVESKASVYGSSQTTTVLNIIGQIINY